MRVRHKIPSIFNLSMVDVLCCALGCVILLWLLNLRDASQKTDEVGATTEQLTLSKQELAAVLAERSGLTKDMGKAKGLIDDLTMYSLQLQKQIDDGTIQLADVLKNLRAAEAQASSTATQLDTTQKERDTLRIKSADLAKLLEALRSQLKDADSQITKQTQNVTTLDARLVAANQKITALEKMVRDKDALALANAQKADSLGARLMTIEDKFKKTQGIADTVPGLELSVKDLRDRYQKEQALASQLEKDVNAKIKEILQLQQDMLLLRGDRTKLAAAEERIGQLTRDLERLRSTADNRFAGITLTGKRVVFLVDMSGSMDRIDKDTLAPGKWKGVHDTLAKVMRSLPELEKFQVILFAEKVQYLLGQDDRWITYDGKTSADKVVQALGAIRPEGGTNMYLGLEAAFKLKAQGMDTIYLLSDGLPNSGPGLTADQTRMLKPTDQAEVLGRHIRTLLKNDWNKSEVEKSRVKINCLGFFYESPDLGAFLWTLARENEGNFVGLNQP